MFEYHSDFSLMIIGLFQNVDQVSYRIMMCLAGRVD